MKAKKLYPDIVDYRQILLEANVSHSEYVELTESNRNKDNTVPDYYYLNYTIYGNWCNLNVSVDMASTASEKYVDYVVASGCPIPKGGYQSIPGLLISNDGITVSCFVRDNGDLVVASYDRNLAGVHLHGNLLYLVP